MPLKKGSLLPRQRVMSALASQRFDAWIKSIKNLAEGFIDHGLSLTAEIRFLPVLHAPIEARKLRRNFKTYTGSFS